MDVDVRKLKTFCLVVDKGSFRRAADWLQISQPSVSQHVAILEREFGVKLLHREGRLISLTSEGHALYTLGQELIKLVDSIPTTFHEMKNLGRGRLAIGASHHIAENLLPEILGEFGRAFPELHVSVRCGNPDQLRHFLKEHVIELAVIGSAPGLQEMSEYVVRPLAADRLVLIVPQGHPMEGRIVQPVDLREMPLLRYVREHPMAWVLGDFFLRHQVEMAPKLEVDSVHLATSLVSTGQFLAIVEPWILKAGQERHGVRIAHLAGLEKLRWEIQVVYPQALDLSFAGWEMVRHLEKKLSLKAPTRFLS